MSWRKLYWGWSGRLSRLQFLLGFYSLGFASTIVMMLLVMSVAQPAPGGGYLLTGLEGWAVLYGPGVFTWPFFASMLVRRAHDLGASGYWPLGWLACVAAIGLLMPSWPGWWGAAVEVLVVAVIAIPMLALFFAPGDKQPNRFGPRPRPGWLP